MLLEEFKSKQDLVEKVICALQEGAAPKGRAFFTKCNPKRIIEEIILSNRTNWVPNDIYFPGRFSRFGDYPLENIDHVALILALTEGPGVHKTEYHGRYPEQFKAVTDKKINVKKDEVVVTIDGRSVKSVLYIYWFSKAKDKSLIYKKRKQLSGPYPISMPG